MIKKYPSKSFLFIIAAFITLTAASCSKNKGTVNPTVVDATPTKLGMYEADSSIYKILYMDVSKVGTATVDYGLIFDTGSGGMVLDAQGVLPASMITSNGFVFTGDSIVVNGITVTNQKQEIDYGDDDSTETKVLGNLAYAPVTIGDPSGNIVIKRLPFFLYYKGINSDGSTAEAHDFDLLGVAPEYDITFANNVNITSPFSYFDPGTGLTKGFKVAALGTANFSLEGTFVPGVVTLGLTASDLSSSSGICNAPAYI